MEQGRRPRAGFELTDMGEQPARRGDFTARLRQRCNALRSAALIALRMMFHQKAKLLGTLAGSVFAVVLAVQQLSILLGLLERNTMFVQNAGADLWIAPPHTQVLQPGQLLSDRLVDLARTTPGVALAEPLVLLSATLQRPEGGGEPVSLVGTALPAMLGGPWNVAAGDRAEIEQPDTLFFEDSEREKYGDLNLGSVRELNGQRVRVGGFTWGLVPFAPAFCFGEIALVRRLTQIASDRISFGLVQIRADADLEAVQQALARRLPEALVMTRAEFTHSIVTTLLREQLGMSFGLSTSFGLVIGFVIVALSMFSSVLDNIREFGTLKAIGYTNFELSVLLLVQSVAYAALGSLLGLALVTRVAELIRDPKLVPLIPPSIFALTPFVMLGLCATASGLALLRVRKLEPGMVFR